MQQKVQPKEISRMIKQITMPQKIAIFEKDCEVSKKELWQQLELITHLVIEEQITLDEAEQYALKIFQNIK